MAYNHYIFENYTIKNPVTCMVNTHIIRVLNSIIRKLARSYPHSGVTASVSCQPCQNSTSLEKTVDICLFFSFAQSLVLDHESCPLSEIFTIPHS